MMRMGILCPVLIQWQSEVSLCKYNKMPATLALRVMLGLIHLFQLYASPIDKSILANGIV